MTTIGSGGGFGIFDFRDLFLARAIGAQSGAVRRPAGPVEAAPPVDDRPELLDARRDLDRLLESLNEIDSLVRAPWADTRRSVAAAAEVSTDPLGMSAAAAATIESTEEVNANPHSHSPYDPEFDLSSTLPTIDGDYDGSNGTDTLTFLVTKSGVRGVSQIRLDVVDGGGGTIASIKINRNDPLDQVYDVGNGLKLQLGAGTAWAGDSFTVDVSDTAPTAVDPDAPLDGVRQDDARLEWGQAVVDGSFEVNGEVIAVSSSDSLHDVVDAVNASAAGVTAEFDAATETVRLTQDTAGAASTIALSNDTSGFLAAVKLDSAVVTPGRDDDWERPLQDVARFAGVSSGAFRINGVDVALDVTTDTLQDVIDRINASAAGATASFDSGAQIVSIASDDDESPLTLAGNGTGFFAALNLQEGSHEASRSERTDRVARRKAGKIADHLEDAAEALNALFDDPAGRGGPPKLIEDVQSRLRRTVTNAFVGYGDDRLSAFGARFVDDPGADRLMEFSRGARKGLVDKLGRGRPGRAIQDIFRESDFADSGGVGGGRLLAGLRSAAKSALASVNRELDTGSILDVRA